MCFDASWCVRAHAAATMRRAVAGSSDEHARFLFWRMQALLHLSKPTQFYKHRGDEMEFSQMQQARGPRSAARGKPPRGCARFSLQLTRGLFRRGACSPLTCALASARRWSCQARAASAPSPARSQSLSLRARVSDGSTTFVRSCWEGTTWLTVDDTGTFETRRWMDGDTLFMARAPRGCPAAHSLTCFAHSGIRADRDA
jgi:hypothetical protein